LPSGKSSLTGDISEQCLFLLLGNGSNGKGVFLKTLSSLMGDYTASANFDTFSAHKNERSGPRDGVADLVGARFVRASESEEGNRLSEAKLKGLVAPDGKIRACRLYQESFEFYPQHKIWLATNHEPAIRGTDDGIWRRIRRVPFNYVVPPEKRVPDLEEKLKPELSGILNWALEGLRDWRDSGLGTSASVRRATADYRDSQNRTKRFFDECIVSAKPTEYALSEDVYGAFKVWCERNGEYHPSQTKFGMEFGKLATRGKAGDGRRAYFAIQLRNHPRRIEWC
jgi:putative DNA primase/helicase